MKYIFIYIFSLLSSIGFGQENLSELLKRYNSETIPYITVQELAQTTTHVTILDAREFKEYDVSHLKNAFFVGYDHFNLEWIKKRLKNKNQDIVVYCSLGVRSERIAKKLKDVGYTNVKNLYGGIFEWKNLDFKVYNSKNTVTDSIHAFSKDWSQWLKKGIKVYPN